MRPARYVLLGAAIMGVLVALFIAARGQDHALARERAEGLRNVLADQLRVCEEHARYLARQPETEVATYLTYFRGLARVRVFDPDRRVLFHAERFEYFVATVTPPRAGPPPPAGFAIDGDRLDVEPRLRHVIHFPVARGDGTLVLTVYAEPFLQPLREAGANLILANGRALLGPATQEAMAFTGGDGWTVTVGASAGFAEALPFLLIAAAVLALGVVAVLLSERQIRALERAAMERRLAQSERLSSVGLLASGIAHEINNPLEGIANWMQLGNLDKAQEGFDRIRSIVRDLLSFARSETAAETADLKGCLDKALPLARFAGVFKDVETELAVPGGLLVRGSPRMLEQVFLNILLNAGAAMQDGDERRVAVTARRTAARVRIAFRDTGPGISPADLSKLFDPFFSRSGGTGLGLSVSYGLVKGAGGDLWAENADGGGARFVVELEAA